MAVKNFLYNELTVKLTSDKNKHPFAIQLDNINYKQNIFLNTKVNNLFEVNFLGFSS